MTSRYPWGIPKRKRLQAATCNPLILLACLEGFEPPTCGLEGRCSIQLSYRHATFYILTN